MRSERFTFTNAWGQELAGNLERPDGEPTAFAIFAHCFTCSRNVFAAAWVSRELAERGFGVLRFDFTGLGSSEGDFANTNFSSNVEDIIAAADALRERYRGPSLLVGHSLGGAAVLAAAGEIPEVAAVATIGAPAEPSHVEHLLAGSREEIEREGRAEVVLAGRRFTIRRQFLEDLDEHSLGRKLAGLGKALLILHSPSDEVVPIDNARRIYEAARHPKSFIALDGADHLLSRREDAEFAARMLAAWAFRHVDPWSRARPEGELEPPAGDVAAAAGCGEEPPGGDRPPEGTVVVREDGPRYGQALRAGRHALRADEPDSAGGADSGPSPYDLLLAALGACTSMTLRMYADRKGWPLEGVEVRLRHDRIHARDCEGCEAQEGRVDRIEREITVRGELDEEQRRRLLEIAEKCPVHRTLIGEKEIRTRLAE